MRCPGCGDLRDRVVDSRQTDDGTAIRRRRECEACGRRFTTFERLEEVALVVRKRDGTRQPFEVAKVRAGIAAAAKARPVGDDQLDRLVAEVEDEMRAEGPEISSEQVGRAVLLRLRAFDPVAAVRFASVYKSFEDIGDFEKEITLLTEPEPGPTLDTTG